MSKAYDGEQCHLDVLYECPDPPDATTPAKFKQYCVAVIVSDNHYTCDEQDGHGVCQFHSSQG